MARCTFVNIISSSDTCSLITLVIIQVLYWGGGSQGGRGKESELREDKPREQANWSRRSDEGKSQFKLGFGVLTPSVGLRG